MADKGQRTNCKIAIRFYSFYNGEMKIARTIFVFVFAAAIFFLCACGVNENRNQNPQLPNTNQANVANANAELPKDNVEELARIIKLPFTPEEVVWRDDNLNVGSHENRQPAPNDKKLVAVLRFSASDANQITAQAGKYKPPVQEEIDAESWFPAELIAKTQLSGDETLKGITYAAKDFLQPPFVNGKITRVAETDYFVLELTSF